jgi:hypothetical protein
MTARYATILVFGQKRKARMNKRFWDLLKRFERSLGPVGAGMVLDLVDFATFGPIGIFLGYIAGSAVSWYLTGVLGLPMKWRKMISIFGGIYCMVPGTELIPVATIVGACARFFMERERDEKKNTDR